MDKRTIKEWAHRWVMTTEGLQGTLKRLAAEAEERGEIGERDRFLKDAYQIDKEVLAPIFWLPLLAFLGLLIWVCSR